MSADRRRQDGDGAGGEADEAQQSVSALRARFEAASASSDPRAEHRPALAAARTTSTMSTASSKISLPEGLGAALSWAESGGSSSSTITKNKNTTTSTSSSNGDAVLRSSPGGPPAARVPAVPTLSAQDGPSPPILPPRPGLPQQAASTGAGPSAQAAQPLRPASSDSASSSHLTPSRPPPPPSHPSSAAWRNRPDPLHAADTSQGAAAPIDIEGSSTNPSARNTAANSAPERSPPILSDGTPSFPPPLLRSRFQQQAQSRQDTLRPQHHTAAGAASPTIGASWDEHQMPLRMSPSHSASVTEDEDEDPFTASSSDEEDDAAGHNVLRFASTAATADTGDAPHEGLTGVSRHFSLRSPRQPNIKHHKQRSIGAKALESVAATSTFLSRSLSTRSPSGASQKIAPTYFDSLSLPGSASTSRPTSSGGGYSSGAPGLGTRTPSSNFSRSSRFAGGIVEQFPDATHVNRRPPCFSPPRSAIARSEFVDFDVCGSIVVTATHDGKVKLYHLPTGARANTSHSGEGLSSNSRSSHSPQLHGGGGYSAQKGGADKVCEIEIRGSKNGIEGAGSKEKITAISFRCPAPAATHAASRKTMGRFVWVATREGNLYEVDLSEARVSDTKTGLHSCAIVLLERVGDKMLAVDEGGKISTWVASSAAAPRGTNSASPETTHEERPIQSSHVTLQTKPSTQRITLNKHCCPLLLGDQLWVCAGPNSSAHHHSSSSSHTASSPPLSGSASAGSGSGLRISVYNPPFFDDRNFCAVSRPITLPRGMLVGAEVGAVCAGATIPDRPELIFLGHESGHVTVWSKATFSCVGVQRLGRHSIVAMAGVVRFLWVGTRAGEICVYDPDTDSAPHWRLLKKWTAHRGPIFKLVVDRAAADVPQLQVGSAGEDGCVHFWDGTLQVDWLDKAVLCRETEFCTFRSLKLFITTFNIDAACPSDLQRSGASEDVEFLEALIGSATRGENAADILAFGFQELIDLEKKSLTAKTLLVGKKRFADDMGAKISANYKDWHDAITRAVLIYAPPDRPYHVVASDSLVGLFTLVFVRQSELCNVRDVATGVTKVGLGGRYGNKGAIATRLVVDDTSLSLVNCHLSAGQRAIKRRNEDVADILEDPDVFEHTVENTDAFVPGGDGRMILDHTLCFLSGDLNYRIDQQRDTTIALVKERRLNDLLALDQLRVQMATNPTFRLRYFTEASPLDFEPTYKYNKHTHEWDSSAKQRIPAWCDRILWREQGADWSRDRRKRATIGDGKQDGASSPRLDSPGSATEESQTGTEDGDHPASLAATRVRNTVEGQGHVRVLNYRRWEPTISDHRPVSGLFEIQVRRVVREQKHSVLAQLREEWREVEGEMVGIANSQWWL